MPNTLRRTAWVIVILLAMTLTPAVRGQTGNAAALYYGRPVYVPVPKFTNIGIQTSVTVPDGGTATLGGYSRSSESRSQFGTPGLGRMPYTSRGVGNVGFGRSRVSGRVNVSARIINLREEEFRQTGYRSP